jgi:hypothetical protein
VSLVNDMLRDLEAGKREPLPDGVFTSEQHLARSTRTQRKILIGLAAVLVPAAFYAGLHWQSETTAVERAQSIASVIPAEVVPLAETLSADLQAGPDADIHEERTAAAPDKAAAADPKFEEQTARIQQLLRDADAALQENRLTTPIADNAFSRYQAVLLLDPAQPDALRGIASIAERYTEFYRQAMVAGRAASAAQYREKAELVVSRYPPLITALSQRLAELDAALAMHSPAAALDSSEADLAQVEPSATATADPAPASQAVRVVRADKDQRIAGQAQALIGQSRFVQAESLLLSHLQDFPESDDSRMTLVDLYLLTENSTAARQQLEQLANVPAHQRAQLRARIAMLDGELETALTALGSVNPGIAEAPDFHAYRAALYHKAAQYRQAADLYEQLLALRNTEATYWLGLAVSLDALKDRDGALRAFRHAHLYSPADAPSRAYVEERIRTLSS